MLNKVLRQNRILHSYQVLYSIFAAPGWCVKAHCSSELLTEPTRKNLERLGVPEREVSAEWVIKI